MKVIIIGAGELGQLLAERLCQSEHDVVMIDTARAEFERVRDRLDVMTLVGEATDVAVMKRAGIESADLLLAVSGDQAANMLACQLARHFGVRRTICRLYSMDGFSEADGITPDFYGIGQCFSSPAECARHIVDVLRRPAVLEQIDFSNAEATVVTLLVTRESPLKGMRVQDFPDAELMAKVRFAALVRRRTLKFPHGDTVLEAGDRLYVAGRRTDVERILDFAEPAPPSDRRPVVVAGTGLLAELVVREALALGRSVTVIEPDGKTAEEFLSRQTDARLRVLNGSANSEDVLREAGADVCDTFVNAEEDDENSILSCIIAKRLGARKVVAVTHKPEYISIVPEMEVIDCGFNSTIVSVNAVFRLMDEGTVRVDSRLESYRAYLTEFKVAPTSRLVGRMVKDARLPKATVLAMIFRGGEVLAPAGKTELQAGDVVVAIVTPASEEQLKPYFT